MQDAIPIESASREIASEYHGTPRRQDIPTLTGLRFVAAFSVLIAHSFSWILKSHEAQWGGIYWVSQASGFGMTLFFVLSGFVIHYNYANLVTKGGLRGAATFLWARFARLYPLFLLMMLAYVLLSSRTLDLLSGHFERFESILRALPYFLLSVQSWFYIVIDGSSLISAIGGGSPITWSISTEWFFYLVYLCIASLVLKAGTWRQVVVLILLWCVLWSSISCGLYDRSASIDAWSVMHFGPVAGMQDHEQDSFYRWLSYFSPYLRFGEFGLGVFMAQLYVRLEKRPVSELENSIGTIALFAAAASAFVITYLNYSPDVDMNIFRKMSMNFALAPTAAALLFCAARYRNVGSRMLMSRTIVVLGDASYSIYLVHELVLASAVKITGSAIHSVAYDVVKLLLLIAVILVMSLTLYAYYESPTRKWLRRR